MIKANYTIFKFYLTSLDFFSEYLSQKYMESSSENTDHYRTIIIQKIVRMFHTLEILTNENQDEVSARCVLRGILDSVATYAFIYQGDDENEVMFRHYLYALDGFKTYKKNVVDGIVEKGDEGQQSENVCKETILQLEEKLMLHPYSKLDDVNVENIIQKSNWKYESLQNPKKVEFKVMYERLGFNDYYVNYCQSFLSQYAHGLFLSNVYLNDSARMTVVLYESIPLADKFIQTIHKTFHDKGMITHFLCSEKVQDFINSKEFKYEDLAEFASAVVRKDKTLLI